MMDEGEARARFLQDGAWAAGVHTDPFVLAGVFPGSETWLLFDAKAPPDPEAPLHRIAPVLATAELEQASQEIILPALRCPRRGLGRVETAHGPIALADIKFEIGRRQDDGALVLADVVDNDSWRIWPGATRLGS